MNLEHLLVQAKATIDALIVDARADRRALAIIVDALLGKARVRRLARDAAAHVVETDERIDEVARRAAVAWLTSIAVEEMAVVVISGTATSATMIVKRVPRSFVEPGFRIEDAMQMGKFFVDTIHALPDEREDVRACEFQSADNNEWGCCTLQGQLECDFADPKNSARTCP